MIAESPRTNRAKVAWLGQGKATNSRVFGLVSRRNTSNRADVWGYIFCTISIM